MISTVGTFPSLNGTALLPDAVGPCRPGGDVAQSDGGGFGNAVEHRESGGAGAPLGRSPSPKPALQVFTGAQSGALSQRGDLVGGLGAEDRLEGFIQEVQLRLSDLQFIVELRPQLLHAGRRSLVLEDIKMIHSLMDISQIRRQCSTFILVDLIYSNCLRYNYLDQQTS